MNEENERTVQVPRSRLESALHEAQSALDIWEDAKEGDSNDAEYEAALGLEDALRWFLGLTNAAIEACEKPEPKEERR